jgi:cation transport ATPase
MEYYISNNGGKYSGPFKKEELLRNGLTPETLVWRQGMTAWMPAKDVNEIAGIFNVAPPSLALAIAARQASPPLNQVDNSLEALAQELAKSRNEIEQLKREVITLENAKKKTKRAAVASKAKSAVSTADTVKTSAGKTKKQEAKKKKKDRYDYPVAPWFTEAWVLMVCVVVHFLMGVTGYTTFSYVYLDIVGAVLCAVGIFLGYRVKQLNKISYAKGSKERIAADKISYFNGLLVSTTAAIGFLIILVQSAHFVYVV